MNVFECECKWVYSSENLGFYEKKEGEFGRKERGEGCCVMLEGGGELFSVSRGVDVSSPAAAASGATKHKTTTTRRRAAM